jgi:hypothetical protein
MTRKRQLNRAITYGGIGAIAAILAFMVFLQVEAARNTEFKKSIDKIAEDTIALTKEYQEEEGKWNKRQYDNSSMISVIDKYQPRYAELADRAKALDSPDRYKLAKEYLIRSIESEMQSNQHLLNYLTSGDPAEYEMSIDLFSKSLEYSAEYDAAIVAAG